jgi:heme oxygenase
MHSFRVPIEAWLSSLTWPAVLGTWRPVFVGEALTADMGDFCLQPRARNNDWHAIREPDTVADLDTIFGTLYVMEGSMLGAQLLLRRARRLGHLKTLALGTSRCEVSTPERRREFLTILEKSPQFRIDNAANAANRAFAAAQSAFLSTMKA